MGQLNLNTCVCVYERVSQRVECMITVTVTHYIFIWNQMCDKKDGCKVMHNTGHHQ